ncbi:MAG TPA: MBL fold metallo-hydrolase [Polyangiaceae bacterium LLY-WYZ-15_(1-7)]|nr:MBL fold hydrolase [Myxococcales bacterium]MAT26693.1 MBL fold hydrolase [Sandaracinus sp.]HJK89798.1 MBL fold metallo-hydrolase [Polyangiaceae bacterium LLY-WYZ-15_(1-7)]MBJ69790.1 MBL fold hydrolase [Sandaracinus sp.]HJL02238.1 MBL fold metallo-hydrolase [Polyangiaceae bacterium LLY-WYZ-15_(1-7)]
MSLTVLPLGTGDAFSAHRYGACLAVQAEGRWLLIDCPHPIRKMLHEGAAAAGLPGLDVGDFEGLALTHLHADHASGLEGWGFFHHFALKRRAVVLTHPLVARELWTTLRPSMGVLLRGPERTPTEYREEDYFDVRPFVDTIELGPFTVRARTTWHHIPTIALRVEAGGKVLGYSADTAFDPALLEWLADADLVVHETNLGGAHTPYAELAALPAELRAKMRLIAYPDAFDPGDWAITPLVEGEPIEC